MAVGIDIGGTLTDVVGVNANGEISLLKIPTTPSDRGAAARQALSMLQEQRGIAPDQIDRIVHGTTVQASAPVLLAPRHLRKGVVERISPQGEVVTPIDARSLAAGIASLLEQKVDAIAVAFLFSYANPVHEREAARVIGMRLDAALAAAAIEAKVARPLGMSVREAAPGIRRVLNAQMAEGIRLVSIRRGYDPRTAEFISGTCVPVDGGFLTGRKLIRAGSV